MLEEHDLGFSTADLSLREFAGDDLPAVFKAASPAALGRDAKAQVAVHARSRLGPDNVTPDGWERASRRIYAPDGFALLAPAMAIHVKVLAETPEA